MSRYLSPEEEAIIEETKKQGEAEAEKEGAKPKKAHSALTNMLVFALVFIAFVFAAYLLIQLV